MRKNKLFKKSNLTYFYLLFIGFGIGFFIITSNRTEKVRFYESDLNEVKQIKLLCILNTLPRTHANRAIHVLQTWGKHCDKVVFASSKSDSNLNAVGFDVTDDRHRLWGKLKHTMKYLHENYLTDYDWFFRGEDDSFMIPENLRYMLTAYKTDDPIYFGYKFNTQDHKRGYFSTNAGFVLSRRTVRSFVEEVMTNEEFRAGKDQCRTGIDSAIEDFTLSLCLDHYDVYAGDGRDPIGRERFSVWDPEKILFNEPDMLNWYWVRNYYSNDEGLTCCSNLSIAFNAVKPKAQYRNYFLTYLLKPFGVLPSYPPLPIKKPFSEVAKLLDMEKNNETLRGF